MPVRVRMGPTYLSRYAAQISGRNRPRSDTAMPWARAQARTRAVVGSGSASGPAAARSPNRRSAALSSYTLAKAAPRNRKVHSWASERVSAKMTGTDGKRV
jgi:hypothetical protein